MAASRYARYAILAVTTAGVAALLLGGAGRRSASSDAERIALFASDRARDSRLLTEEAIRLAERICQLAPCAEHHCDNFDGPRRKRS